MGKGVKSVAKCKICEICGVNFETSHHKKVFCSAKCRVRKNYLVVKSRKDPRTCKICGKIIPLKSPEFIYCSKECFYKAYPYERAYRARKIAECA